MGNNNKEDFIQAIQDWIQEQQRKGAIVDQEGINKNMGEILNLYNNVPASEYQGFTLKQMDDMDNIPFEEGCPVQIRHLTQEEISQIPIMRQVLHLMNALEEHELKLTAKGNLPIKMVEALYELGVHSKYSDYYKDKLTEDKCIEAAFVRSALEGTGLIKKRFGKLSLTAKGKKLLKDYNALLKAILIYLFGDFNAGMFDGFEDELSGNLGRLYSLWLLHHYGSNWRQLKLYAKDYYKAMDFIGERVAYTYRIFESLFRIIGLCEIREIRDRKDPEEPYGYERLDETIKTPLVDMIFSFVEPAKM